jgi:hypothetical protein
MRNLTHAEDHPPALLGSETEIIMISSMKFSGFLDY